MNNPFGPNNFFLKIPNIPFVMILPFLRTSNQAVCVPNPSPKKMELHSKAKEQIGLMATTSAPLSALLQPITSATPTVVPEQVA